MLIQTITPPPALQHEAGLGKKRGRPASAILAYGETRAAPAESQAPVTAAGVPADRHHGGLPQPRLRSAAAADAVHPLRPRAGPHGGRGPRPHAPPPGLEREARGE